MKWPLNQINKPDVVPRVGIYCFVKALGETKFWQESFVCGVFVRRLPLRFRQQGQDYQTAKSKTEQIKLFAKIGIFAGDCFVEDSSPRPFGLLII